MSRAAPDAEDEWERREIVRFRRWLGPKRLGEATAEDLRFYAAELAKGTRLLAVARRMALIRTAVSLSGPQER